MKITPEALQHLSANYIHSAFCGKTSPDDVPPKLFRSYFWLSPEAASELYELIYAINSKIKPVHLLIYAQDIEQEKPQEVLFR